MINCLIVDDSRVIRKVSRHMVEELGFHVSEAENGLEAVEHCRGSMPDLILLDWNMPQMPGIDFLLKLREMDGGDRPKVVFCTTENDAEHILRASDSGADEYVMKPFDHETLRMKLQLLGMV